jgi:hypothetical protein
MAIISGWGRGTWSQGTWGEPIPVVVTGEAATGAVGSVVVVAEANVPVTGLEATGGVGTVLVSAAANVAVTGLEATGVDGNVTVVAAANVFPTGVEATGAAGTVTVDAAANVPVTGLEATGAVGTVVFLLPPTYSRRALRLPVRLARSTSTRRPMSLSRVWKPRVASARSRWMRALLFWSVA